VDHAPQLHVCLAARLIIEQEDRTLPTQEKLFKSEDLPTIPQGILSQQP
jgi:hypothetical protein